MLLDVGDKQYAVHFLHREFRFTTATDVSCARSHTYCSVHLGKCVVKRCGEGKHPYTGTAHCHPNDQFSKSAGRKVSLSRAISGLPRETRRLIWNEYFKICPHK